MTMNLDLDDLVVKAKAATPGEWIGLGTYVNAAGSTDTFYGPVYGTIVSCEETEQADFEGRIWTTGGTSEANAAFIAAANPAAILALTARVRELEAALKPFVYLANSYTVGSVPDDFLLTLTNGSRMCGIEAGKIRAAALAAGAKP